MAEIIYDLMEERASKGIVHDYKTNVNSVNRKYKQAPYVYETLMDMVELDPVLFTAVSLTVDLSTGRGYGFIGDSEDQITTATEKFNNELDFDKAIKNVIWSLIIYGDAYLEVRWNESHTEVMELFPRDTQDMRMDYDKHGEIIGYLELVQGQPPEKAIKYKPDEIVRFSMYQVGSQVYSRNPLKAAARDFSTGVVSRDYVHGIFTNLPPKIIYFLKNANDKQRKDFIQNVIVAKRTPGMDIVAQGEEFDAKVAQLDFTGLIDILNWNSKRILMVTRCPPHWVGMLDGANRGIGENVVIPYETKIKSIQHEIESQINRELMPHLKYDKLKFKFNAISLMGDKTITDIMKVLKDTGLDGESIVEYGRDNGLQLSDSAIIEKIEMPPLGGAPQSQSGKPGEQAGKKNPKEKMGNKLNAQGVSPDGKRKLEAKKVAA